MGNDPRVGSPTGPDGMCMRDGVYVYVGADLEASAMAVDAMPDSVDKARHLMGLGEALIRERTKGQQQAGIARFRNAVKMLTTLGADLEKPSHITADDVLEAKAHLASALVFIGEKNGAREIFKEVAEGWTEVANEDLRLGWSNRLSLDYLNAARAFIRAGELSQARSVLNSAMQHLSNNGDMEGLMEVLGKQSDIMRDLEDREGLARVTIYMTHVRELLIAEKKGDLLVAADTSVRYKEFGNAQRLYNKAFLALKASGRPIQAAEILMTAARDVSVADIRWRIEAVESAVETFTEANDIDNAQKARLQLAVLYTATGEEASAFACERTIQRVDILLLRLQDVLASRRTFIDFAREWQDREDGTELGEISLKQWAGKYRDLLEAQFGPMRVGKFMDAIHTDRLDACGFYTRDRERTEGEQTRRDLLDPMRDAKRGK